jgi:hypothetical protein
LILDALVPKLWVFAVSQLFYGLARGLQRGQAIERNRIISVEK